MPPATASNRSGLRGTTASRRDGNSSRNRRYAARAIASSPGPVLPQTQIGSVPGRRPTDAANASTPGGGASSSAAAVSNFIVPTTAIRSRETPRAAKRSA